MPPNNGLYKALKKKRKFLKKYMLQMFMGLITSYREYLTLLFLLDDGQKEIKNVA